LVKVKEKELQNITKDEWEFVEKISSSLEKFSRLGINSYQG